MARRRRKGTHGFGNIISVRKGVNGLLDSNSAVGIAVPIVGGMVAAAGGAKLVRMVAPTPTTPTTAGINGFVQDYAALLGALIPTVLGAALVKFGGQRQAGIAMMASGLGAGLLAQFGGRLGISGFGAIVPEYSGVSGLGAVMPVMPGTSGLGATVLEEWPSGQRPDSIGALGDAYGTSVDLSGLGSVNTSAFGTPGFRV